jgi:hypothetical protein
MIVPFRFALPPSCEPTSLREAATQIIWRLRVSAAAPAIGYRAEFEVPVSLAEFPSNDTVAAQGPVEITAGGDRSAAEWFLFGAFVTGAFTLAAYLGDPDALSYLASFIALVGLAVLVLGVDVLIGKTDLRADREAIRVRRTWLGIGRTRSIPAADVRSVHTRDGVAIGSRAYYDVVLGLERGGSTKVLKHLNVGEADALAARIAGAIRPS